MKKRVTVLFLICALVLPVWLQAGANVYTLTAQQWAMPRQDRVLIEFPALQAAMEKFRKHSGSRLLIRYPGGDEGTLWLNELQSWLVALGVASTDMELIPGSSQQTVIEIEVVTGNSAVTSTEAMMPAALSETQP